MSNFEKMKLAVIQNEDDKLADIVAEMINDFCLAKDFVPVIRCKDCKYYNTDGYVDGYGECEGIVIDNNQGGCGYIVMTPNSYCFSAERKV